MQLILQVKAQNVVVGTKKMTESVMEEANGGLSAGDSTSIFAPEDDLQAETLEMSPDCLVKVPGSFELEEPSLSTIEPTKNNEQFAYIYNNHNESIFDDEQFFPSLLALNSSKVAKFDENNPQVLNHATVKALIVHLTSPDVIDYSFVCDFFLTYRTFTDSHEVMDMILDVLFFSEHLSFYGTGCSIILSMILTTTLSYVITLLRVLIWWLSSRIYSSRTCTSN